ncbi:hypothetical protein UFOVP1366_18 [uncultured Caudovirales phage]|uniref:Uncharacterized protein n=1 Tax=uncultured Caudovirales phage TaxID=2100421 RepID=A0A6J5RV10_9CAUD|nr:hypothetical protein UFOVP1366_18 [uncultured Caudovirales phage]
MELLRPLDDSGFATQSVAYTGTAGSVTGWNAGPQGVLVWCTSDAYIRVGEGVTATTAATPIPAGVPVPIFVPGGTGATWRVSAIQISASGTLYAKPINIR